MIEKILPAMMNVKKLARVLGLLCAVFLLAACTDYELEYEEEYGYLLDAGGDEDESSSSSTVIASSSSAKQSSSSIVYGTLTDSRDGQVYKTVTIGSGASAQTWMAQNLNYEPGDVSGMGSYAWSGCYNNSADSCAKYGRLYTWEVAMDKAGCGYGESCNNSYEGTQGICPEGWHLPSTAEWGTLFTNVGGTSSAGTMLKSTSGWYNGGNGEDNYGFAVLPAGYRDFIGYFNSAGSYAGFWSSTEYIDNAYGEYFDYDNSNVSEDVDGKIYAFSVRCLRNSNGEAEEASSSSSSAVIASSSSSSTVIASSSSAKQSSSSNETAKIAKGTCEANPISIVKGNTVNWKATRMGGTFVTYDWTFSEGGSITSSKDSVPSVKYDKPGTYSASLFINKGTDTTSAEITCKVTVTGVPVKGCVCSSPDAANTLYYKSGAPAATSWKVSGCTGGNSFNYAWGGTGITGSSTSATGSFTKEGSFAPTLNVTNEDGASMGVTCPAVKVEAVEGTMTDSRDGKTYKTVKIGTQIWMAENLNYAASGSLCYGGTSSNCTKYGRLYPWYAAMGSTESLCGVGKSCSGITYPHQGACPSGWHLPTYTEWKKLFDYVDSNNGDESVEASLADRSFSKVGGTNRYLFSALPSGYWTAGHYYFNNWEKVFQASSYEGENSTIRLWAADRIVENECIPVDYMISDPNSTCVDTEYGLALNVSIGSYGSSMVRSDGAKITYRTDAYSIRCVHN